jgi:hypothetical protein
MISKMHVLERVDVTGTGAFALDQITNQRVNPAIEKIAEIGAGQVDPSFSAILKIIPVCSFSTSAIGELLSNVDLLAGLACPNSTVITAINLYFSQVDNNGTRKSGSNHLEVAVNAGLIVVDTVTVDQDGAASADCTIHAYYDGTNVPLVFTDSHALPSGTPDVDELFGLGPAWINGTQVDALTGVSIKTGIEIEKRGSDGRVYATRQHIKTRKPMIDLKTINAVNMATFGLAGAAQGGTASDLYLQELEANGTRTAIATENHVRIRVNANQGAITLLETSAEGQSVAECGLRIEPVVGSAAILTTTVGVAIPSFT